MPGNCWLCRGMLIHVALEQTLLLKMNAASLSSTNYSSETCDIAPQLWTALWTILSGSRLPSDVTLNWLETLLWKAAAPMCCEITCCLGTIVTWCMRVGSAKVFEPKNSSAMCCCKSNLNYWYFLYCMYSLKFRSKMSILSSSHHYFHCF